MKAVKVSTACERDSSSSEVDTVEREGTSSDVFCEEFCSRSYVPSGNKDTSIKYFSKASAGGVDTRLRWTPDFGRVAKL
jgi:hypothetical protein